MDSHRLIYGLFGLLAAMVAGTVAALTALEVNEAVPVADGELLAETPRFVARAPYPVQVERVLVAEGDRVAPGALLLVLRSEQVDAELAQAEAEERSLRDELTQVEAQVGTAAERVAAYRERIVASRDQFRIERRIASEAASALARQRTIAHQQDSLVRAEVERSRVLFGSGMLSQAELERARRELLTAENSSADVEKRYTEQVTVGEKLDASSRAELLQLQSDLLTIEAARLALAERAQTLRRSIEKQGEEVRLRRRLAGRKEIRAEIGGTVRYLYNTRSARDYLDPGEVLVEVSPDAERSGAIYAKLRLHQDDLNQLHAGQRASLRLDAYQYFKYGGLAGTVRYVSPPSDSNEFYAIVDLERRADIQLRPGYRVRGEVVLGRMPLYRLLLKKLFREMEPRPAAAVAPTVAAAPG